MPLVNAGVLLGGSLQLAAGGDLHALAGGDLDGCARRGVTTCASGAVRLLERDPTRDGDLGAFTDRLRDDGEEGVDDAGDGGLALARLRRNGGDEVVLVE